MAHVEALASAPTVTGGEEEDSSEQSRRELSAEMGSKSQQVLGSYHVERCSDDTRPPLRWSFRLR